MGQSRSLDTPPRSKFGVYVIHIYICIIYTPNLGWGITVPGREREQGRFRGSIEGAPGSSEGAPGSSEGAVREQMDERSLSARALSVTCY